MRTTGREKACAKVAKSAKAAKRICKVQNAK